jgi:HlyD family secretion protein
MSTIILALLVGGGIFYARSRGSESVTKYVLGTATQGTIISTITGSGQVSSEREIELSPIDATGNITAVHVKQGQEVKEGDLIVTIDQTDALKEVRSAERTVQDAQNGVKMAQLSLDELKQPADATDLLKAQNTLNSALRDLQNLKDGADQSDIDQARSQLEIQEQNTRLSEDGVTSEIVREVYDNVIVEMRTLTQTLKSALQTVDSILGVDQISANLTYQQHLGVRYSGVIDQARSQYSIAKTSTDILKKQTDALQASSSSREDIEEALAYVQKSVTHTDTLLQTMQRVMDYSVTSASFSQTTLDNLRSSINSARTSVTSKVSSASDYQREIDDAQTSYQNALISLHSAQTALDDLVRGSDADDIASAEEKVEEAQVSYDDLKKGADELELLTSEQSLAQKRSTLASAVDACSDARNNLENYTVKAPFDGVIATVPVAIADEASPSVTVATLITKVKIATLTLNEVDVVKVKKGQQATLTFDAVENLTLAGTVAQVDIVGSANSGVVGYGVKIAFTTDDERIKSGMSVSATIQTDVRADVVTVPSSAIQASTSGASYVLTLPNVTAEQASASPDGITSDTQPERTAVTVGLADDTNIEILTGLEAGDVLVIKTVQSSATTAKTTTASKSLMQSLGGNSGSGMRQGGAPPGM